MHELHLLSDQYLLDLLNQCNRGHLTIDEIHNQHISVTISPLPARPLLLQFAQRYHWYQQAVDREGLFNIPLTDEVTLAQAYNIDDQQNTVTLTFPLEKKPDLKQADCWVRTNHPLALVPDLKALLIYQPIPAPIPCFSLLYWCALWQAIAHCCRTLLGRPEPAPNLALTRQQDMTDVTAQFTRFMPLPTQAIIDHDKRRLQVSFSSPTPLQRQIAFSDPWIEILGHEKQEVDLSRLNAGAAVLYNHDHHHPDHHLGIVEKAWIEDDRGLAIIRLSKRQAVDGLWQDIQEGIIQHVSVGYLIKQRHRQQRSGDEQTETYRITRWQPQEISIVTLPADISVGIGRSDNFNDNNFNLNRSKKTMENQTKASEKPATEPKKVDQSALAQSKDPAGAQENTKVAETLVLEKRSQDVEAIQAATLATERKRRQIIRTIFTNHQDKHDLCERCLDDPHISGDLARQLLLDDLGHTNLAANIDTNASIICDERDKFKRGVENALLFRAGLAELDTNNEFQSYKLAELARVSLAKAEGNTSYASSMALIGRAFTHSSSDFPTILSNTANKALLKGYSEVSETFMQWTSQGSLSDFKVNSRVDLNVFPSLKEIPASAEYKYATLGERQETIQLATFGAMFSITRQAIINDDLNTFTQIPRKMGQAASRTVANLAYAILTDNPKMADGDPLFSKAHHNMADKKSPFNVQALSQARLYMATQQLEGVTLNITPAFLIVPVALEGQAKVLMNSETDLDQANARVPNAVRGLAQVIADPRLDAVSPTTWYLTANPHQFDVLEVAYLEGNAQPTLEEQVGWLIDGISYKVRLDAGVKALDFRTFYRGEVG